MYTASAFETLNTFLSVFQTNGCDWILVVTAILAGCDWML